MRSGNLKHKIDFTAYAEIKNGFGEVEKSFSVFKTTYADIVAVSGKEYFASKQTNAEVSHKIECRFISGITPSMRIVYGVRVFNIESVINIREENKTLQIMASEVISG